MIEIDEDELQETYEKFKKNDPNTTIEETRYILTKRKIEANTILNCVVLHFFEEKTVKWRDYFYYLEELWQSFDLKPHMGICYGDNYGWSTHSKSYRSVKNKLEKHDFQKSSSFNNVVILPEYVERKEVGLACSYGGVSFGDYMKMELNPFEAKIYFVLDNNILPANDARWLEITKKMHAFTTAKYGYFFQLPLKHKPSWYSSGYSYDNKLPTYYIERWSKAISYNNTVDKKIREIFELNFLSSNQLATKIEGINLSFREWIEQGNRGSLESIGEDFYAWRVPFEKIQGMYEELLDTGFMICVPTTSELDAMQPKPSIFAKLFGQKPSKKVIKCPYVETIGQIVGA